MQVAVIYCVSHPQQATISNTATLRACHSSPDPRLQFHIGYISASASAVLPESTTSGCMAHKLGRLRLLRAAQQWSAAALKHTGVVEVLRQALVLLAVHMC